jgi:hypothetical protein
VARVSRRRCVLFLVSDFLAQTAPVAGERDWTQRLRELAQRHDVIAARVTDPFELDLPKAGLVELVEGETGRIVEVDTRSKAVRDSWRERARRTAPRSRGSCRARAPTSSTSTRRRTSATRS